MSEAIPIFEHLTATGSVTPALVAARGAFVRATNLPADWKKVRICLLYSLRGAGPTDPPVVETMPATTNLLGQAQIGLTNGAGMPGRTDVRFVGVGCGLAASETRIGNYSSEWRTLVTSATSTYITLGGRVADGTTVTYQASGTRVQTTGIATPLGTATFAECLTLELSVVTAATLTMQFGMTRPLAPATPAAVGVLLENALTALPSSFDNTAGGWWSSSVPVGCTTLFVRLPFNNNRLAILGYKVAQVG